MIDSLVIPLAAAAYVLAQGSKYLLARAVGAKVDLTASGGMPSSHAATIAAATTVIGIEAGFGSPLFGLSCILTAIVAHDAYRVRWLLGQYGVRLNLLSTTAKLTDGALAEWRGHRPVEILVGLLLGIAIGSVAWVL